MPRIRLAYWHGPHAPGDEVDVTADEFATLSRDGRIAETLPDTKTAAPAAASNSDDADGRRRKH